MGGGGGRTMIRHDKNVYDMHVQLYIHGGQAARASTMTGSTLIPLYGIVRSSKGITISKA